MAEDPDRDLRTLEWGVWGADRKTKVGKRVDLAGGQARESFEATFPDVADFTVVARFTAASGRVGEVSWWVTVKSP